jgi:hypothetical protein
MPASCAAASMSIEPGLVRCSSGIMRPRPRPRPPRPPPRDLGPGGLPRGRPALIQSHWSGFQQLAMTRISALGRPFRGTSLRWRSSCIRHRRASFQAAGKLTAATGSTATAGRAQRRHQRLRRRLRGPLVTGLLRRNDRVVVADRNAEVPRLAQDLFTTALNSTGNHSTRN